MCDKGPKIASTRHRDNPLLQIRQDRLGNKRCDKQSHCVVCGDNHHVKEHWIASTGLGPPDFTHVKGGLCGGCDSRELETLSGCDPITHPIVNHIMYSYVKYTYPLLDSKKNEWLEKESSRRGWKILTCSFSTEEFWQRPPLVQHQCNLYAHFHHHRPLIISPFSLFAYRANHNIMMAERDWRKRKRMASHHRLWNCLFTLYQDGMHENRASCKFNIRYSSLCIQPCCKGKFPFLLVSCLSAPHYL